jgi:hypothetical protein
VTTILDGRGSVHASGKKFVCSPKRPHWLWGPSSLQYGGYQRPLPWK